MPYYEISFFSGMATTEESIQTYGEGGICWYLDSPQHLSHEEVVAEALINIEAQGTDQSLLQAADHVDYVREIDATTYFYAIGAI